MLNVSQIVTPTDIAHSGDCPHNVGVVCWENDNCCRCGWNPAVIPQRKFMVKYLLHKKWREEAEEAEDGLVRE